MAFGTALLGHLATPSLAMDAPGHNAVSELPSGSAWGRCAGWPPCFSLESQQLTSSAQAGSLET